MKSQQEEIYILIEKLFDAKLCPIEDNLKEIKKALFGNGKSGFFNRVEKLEDKNSFLEGKWQGIGIMVAGIFSVLALLINAIRLLRAGI